jgi:hypothetical protein
MLNGEGGPRRSLRTESSAGWVSLIVVKKAISVAMNISSLILILHTSCCSFFHFHVGRPVFRLATISARFHVDRQFL